MKIAKLQKGDSLPLVAAEKKWVTDWYSNPATKLRMGADSTNVPNILSAIDKVGITTKSLVGSILFPFQGSYDINNHHIKINPKYTDDSSLYTHELTHASGYVPKDLPNRYDTTLFNPPSKDKAYWNYYSEPEEHYAKLMAVRRMLNKKPGEMITPEEIKNLGVKNLQVKQLKFMYKDEETLSKILNTIAENSVSKSIPIPFGQQGLKISTDPKSNPNRFMQYLYSSPRINNILKAEGIDVNAPYRELRINTEYLDNAAVPRMFHGDTPIGYDNKIAEALYRGIARGFIDTKSGPGLISEKMFVSTSLKNPQTGIYEDAKRAERFWNSQVKLTHAKDEQAYYIMVKNWLAPILGGTAAYASQSDK